MVESPLEVILNRRPTWSVVRTTWSLSVGKLFAETFPSGPRVEGDIPFPDHLRMPIAGAQLQAVARRHPVVTELGTPIEATATRRFACQRFSLAAVWVSGSLRVESSALVLGRPLLNRFGPKRRIFEKSCCLFSVHTLLSNHIISIKIFSEG